MSRAIGNQNPYLAGATGRNCLALALSFGGLSALRARPLASLLALASLAAALAAHAEEEASPAFEKPPTLHAQDLAPAKWLEGPGFRVEDAVTTDGYLARFLIRADIGAFEAHGVETLALRVAEIEAMRALGTAIASEPFARAVAAVAARGADAPSLPGGGLGGTAGIERFFGPPQPVDAQVMKVVLGHDQERRELARRLGVDPYTLQPALAGALRDVAWISYAGDAQRATLVAPIVRERPALPGSRVAHAWVYDTPEAELIEKNAARMREIGASAETTRQLAANPHVSLSVETALVEALGRLPDAKGRGDVLAYAATLDTPDQALFLTRAVGILADRNEQAPVVEIQAHDPLIARQQGGQLVAVVPADTLSWTERFASFARRADLAAPQRGIWISGRASARARTELEALGWAVHEGVKP